MSYYILYTRLIYISNIVAEANEIGLVEGELIVQVIQIDEGWWEGTNSQGHRGFFPANYVELVSEEAAATASVVPEAAAAHTPSNLPSAVAIYDYEAGEENEITFSEGEVITDIDFVSEDWWSGSARGIIGLFPSNYVELKH